VIRLIASPCGSVRHPHATPLSSSRSRLTLGLPLSERTAHRILGGELTPVDTVLSQAQVEEESPAVPAPDIYRDRRSLKIHHTDLARFKQDMARAFDDLAERYYLHLKGEPKVSVTRDGIRVSFDVDKEE
jgi:hypothetical protein